MLIQGTPARDRKRFATQQDTQLVFGLNHLPLKFRRAGRGIGPFRFKLIRSPVSRSSLDATALARSAPTLPMTATSVRDVELQVKLEKIEVGFGHGADQLNRHRTAVLFLGQQIRARRLGGSSDAPPQIYFPRQVA